MDEFERILQEHRLRYPLMRPQDFGKLAYQSEFGPEHLIADEREVAERLLREWQTADRAGVPRNPEPIGSGLCRFHLTSANFSGEAPAILADLFIRSAQEHRGTREGLERRLELLARLPVGGMAEWLNEYHRQGCPPVHHSEVFRNAYRPHYRVLLAPLAERFPLLLDENAARSAE